MSGDGDADGADGPDGGGHGHGHGQVPARSPWDPPDGTAPVPPPWGSWTEPGAQPGPGFGVGIGAGAGTGSTGGGHEPLRGVRGQRHGGPRFSGRGLLAVFGILGLLVTLAIMAMLAVKVLDGVGGTGSDAATGLGSATTAVTTPGSTGAGGATTTGPSGQNATTPVQHASAAACDADKDTVQTAAEAYLVTNGTYPRDIAALVAGGFVSSDGPLNMELHVTGGTVVVTGTGPCAGR